MNAKERRMLKRQAERQAQEAAGGEHSKAAAGQEAAPKAAAPAVKAAGGRPAAAAAAAAGPEGGGAVNAKERRRLKREAERAAALAGGTPGGQGEAGQQQQGGREGKRKRESSGGQDDEEGQGGGGGKGGSRPSNKKARKEKAVPYVVFVGQLSFKTTGEALQQHLKAGGVQGAIKVRLRTDKNTGKSRGQAFVELDDAENLHRCLTLHHTRLDGRCINVEKSCGGRQEDKRKEKIQQNRSMQVEVMRETRDRIVAEKVQAGQLAEDELDSQALGMLERYDGELVSSILEAYCGEERKGLRNPSAFFMAIAKKVVDGTFVSRSKDGHPDQRPGNKKGQDRKGDKKKQGGGAHKGERRPVKKEEEEQQQGEDMEVVKQQEEEEEEEERGWTIGEGGHQSVAHLAKVKLPPPPPDTTHKEEDQDDGDYDLSRVFRSVRGRGGGGRLGGRGGRGGGRGGSRGR